VGYDAATGEQRAAVETTDVMLAMDAGFGALWAVEASDDQYPDTVLRIDPATGQVTARIPAPEPGVLPESSLAVTDDAVWALTGQFEDPEDRSLAAVDPVAGTVRDVCPAPPGAAAVRGGFGSLWVSVADGSVVRVDPGDGSTQATVDTGRGPRFLTVTEDAVWVLDNLDGTVSRIDPETDEVVATVTVSARSVEGGDIAAGEGSVWARTTAELATEIDTETNEVVRVLGPPAGSGSVAVAGGMVWLTAHDVLTTYRVPLS
jgi:DNA-binding beta-propeller fold protein YncE